MESCNVQQMRIILECFRPRKKTGSRRIGNFSLFSSLLYPKQKSALHKIKDSVRICYMRA